MLQGLSRLQNGKASLVFLRTVGNNERIASLLKAIMNTTLINREGEVAQGVAVPMSSKHVLPPLPYAYDALEPCIDARTLTLHHDKHHQAYVTNLNAALEKSPELRERSAAWLLLNLDKVAEASRSAVHNNAGGHLNHSLFWRAMSPKGGGTPGGALGDAIKRDFGSFDQFKAQFDEAGERLFGSGWVWLAQARKDGGKLQVVTTSGHDNPLMQGHMPLLSTMSGNTLTISNTKTGELII